MTYFSNVSCTGDDVKNPGIIVMAVEVDKETEAEEKMSEYFATFTQILSLIPA